MSDKRRRLPVEDELPPIEPLHERWQPAADPSTIEVPGLDSTAPVQDQIEQIEQLITIKLQNIDANLARAHQILSTRILPAVKRFAVNTEPVRDAARFWVSFYEQAAQVRIPTSDDLSAEYDQQTESHEDNTVTDAQTAEDDNHAEEYHSDATPSDSSFAPGDALMSSTPMTQSASRTRQTASLSHNAEESQSSWAASLESPLDRLDRGLKSLREEDEPSVALPPRLTASSSRQTEAFPPRPPVFTATEKGKGKQQQPTLLQNVLSRGLRADTAPASPKRRSHTSPLKVRARNPYVAAHGGARADWDGVVDLAKPATPQRSARHPQPAHEGAPASEAWQSDDDDSDDDLPPGMSPPVTMDFARPPRSAARLGRTPVREAAARIGRDLVGDAERRTFAPRPLFGTGMDASEETSRSSKISTPSLSMYARRAMGIDSQSHSVLSSAVDPSLENMMRQVGLAAPGQSASGDDDSDSFDSSFGQTPPPGQGLFAHAAGGSGNGGSDSDSSSDSFGEENPGAPSAAFLMASERAAVADDSFGGSDRSSDSFSGDEDVGASGPAIHPFANAMNAGQEDDGFDDSFDDMDDGRRHVGGGDDEPTVFGVPPAQRAAQAAAAVPRSGSGGLRLHGQDLLEDTVAMGALSHPDPVQETPTPWGVPGRGAR